MIQLMPLPLTVSCFSKIQIGFTFLVPAHPGGPGKGAVKRVCVQGQQQQTHHMCRMMGQTDGQMPDSFIDPAPHTVRAVSKTECMHEMRLLPIRYGDKAAVGRLDRLAADVV